MLISTNSKEKPNGVSINDIADNLTTNNANKVLSARQGYILNERLERIENDYVSSENFENELKKFTYTGGIE